MAFSFAWRLAPLAFSFREDERSSVEARLAPSREESAAPIGASPHVALRAPCGGLDACPGGQCADPAVAPCPQSVPQHRTPRHSMLLSPRRPLIRRGRAPFAATLLRVWRSH